MDLPTKTIPLVFQRDATAAATNGAEELLKLLQNPFAGQVGGTSSPVPSSYLDLALLTPKKLAVGSIWASVGSSFGVTAGIALLFSLIRPYHTVLYAPKLKHADEQHTPPQVGKGFFAWMGPLWNTNEQDLVRLVGLDATVFMRFTTMCRNIFLIIAILGCAILVPVNYAKSVRFTEDVWLNMMGPLNVYGDPQWMNVAMIWTMNIIVALFLWWNYKKILKLRREYFNSQEYQMSLHSRTLMVRLQFPHPQPSLAMAC